LLKRLFLVLGLVWVAGWLWAFHKAVPFGLNLNCFAAKISKLEDNGTYTPLIIFYQQSLQMHLFWVLCLIYVANWLRYILQVANFKQKQKRAKSPIQQLIQRLRMNQRLL
jgi:hypothetical protein